MKEDFWTWIDPFYKRKTEGQVDSDSLCHNIGQYTKRMGRNTIKHIIVVQVKLQGLSSKVLAG